MIPDEVWRWIRYELSSEDFGWWVFDTPDELRAALPASLANALIELNEQCAPLSGPECGELQERFTRELPRACACPLMCDRQWLPLGGMCMPQEVDAQFERLAERTPWLDLLRCRRCGQHWYVACDTVDDNWYFQRLDAGAAARALAGEWPHTFDAFTSVWPGGDADTATAPQGFSDGVMWHFTIPGEPRKG